MKGFYRGSDVGLRQKVIWRANRSVLKKFYIKRVYSKRMQL